MKEIDEILENYTELSDSRKAELKVELLDLFSVMGRYYPKTEKCTDCNGTGEINQGEKPSGGHYIEDCYKCGGTGQIKVDD